MSTLYPDRSIYISDGCQVGMKRGGYGISPFTHFHTGKLGVCFGPFFTLNTLRYPG